MLGFHTKTQGKVGWLCSKSMGSWGVTSKYLPKHDIGCCTTWSSHMLSCNHIALFCLGHYQTGIQTPRHHSLSSRFLCDFPFPLSLLIYWPPAIRDLFYAKRDPGTALGPLNVSLPISSTLLPHCRQVRTYWWEKILLKSIMNIGILLETWAYPPQ